MEKYEATLILNLRARVCKLRLVAAGRMILWWCWLLAVLAPPAAGAAVTIGGNQYQALSGWCREAGYKVAWIQRGKTLQVSGRGGSARLTIDSREASFEGAQLWLLLPAVAKGDAAYLSSLDLDATLKPLLSPPSARPGRKLRTICLDPGHGGKDPGNRVSGQQEKTHALLLAQELREALKRAGFKVILTRSTDAYVDLPIRPELARRRGADLFISLHYNSAARKSAQGAEVYCLTPAGAASTNAGGEVGSGRACPGNRWDSENLQLAFRVQKALITGLGAEDRGIRRARFAVLRDATMPAVLVEAGFMSHAAEGKKVFSTAYRKQIARAITAGVLAYRKTVEDRKS